MALDYAFLNVLAMQLDQRLRNARIEKIIMPSRDEVVFNRWFMEHPDQLYGAGLLAVWHLVKDFFPKTLATLKVPSLT